MARDSDDKAAERATRKALARIRRARDAVTRAIADAGDSDAAETPRAELTDWEDEFMASVEARLNEYGSAFADPAKGAPGEALSRLQLVKLKEIEAKARGKPRAGFTQKRSGFRSKTAPMKPRSRDIHEDVDEPAPAREKAVPSPPRSPAPAPAPAKAARPVFKVIKGGKED
ncbi:MAG: hypothetical protein LAT81_09935 [Oceanicaulis sp.]|nr:hypothetical protein [Oceanicaulis sp.]